MAEESTTSVESTEQVEEQAEERHETDWKAEARKWETRAKENKAAAEELEQLKASQMTELEKAQAEAAKAQAEADALKAEKAKSDAAVKLSEKHGIPASMLMHCTDEDAMKDFAAEWDAYHESQPRPHVGTLTSASRIVKPDKGAARTSAANAIADFFSNR